MHASRTLAFGFATAALMAMGGTAVATDAFQGQDVSRLIDSDHKAKICDNESDGRGAYVSYSNGRYEMERISDQDGAGGSCWQNTWDVSSGILDHRTCEKINNWPDACGKISQHF